MDVEEPGALAVEEVREDDRYNKHADGMHYDDTGGERNHDDHSEEYDAGSGACCAVHSGEGVTADDAAAEQKQKSPLAGSGK